MSVTCADQFIFVASKSSTKSLLLRDFSYWSKPIVQIKVDLLCQGLRTRMEGRKAAQLGAGYYDLSPVVILGYSFGTSWHLLGSAGFEHDVERTIMTVLKSSALRKQLPWLKYIHQTITTRLNENIPLRMSVYSLKPNKRLESGFKASRI
jgi:hypothetical protein